MNISSFSLLPLPGLLLVVLAGTSACFPSTYWGHYFTIKNYLYIEIDSLEIRVGEVGTMLYADSLGGLEGDIEVPKEGYPHPVVFQIYSGSTTVYLEGDSFNCYNCTGHHLYRLTLPKAEYEHLP